MPSRAATQQVIGGAARSESWAATAANAAVWEMRYSLTKR